MSSNGGFAASDLYVGPNMRSPIPPKSSRITLSFNVPNKALREPEGDAIALLRAMAAEEAENTYHLLKRSNELP